MNRKTIVIGILFVFLMTIMAGCGPADKAEKKENASSSAKQAYKLDTSRNYGDLSSFSAATLNGGKFSKKDLQKYDVTVIDFWSTECGPCVEEMPEFARFKKTLPSNVNIVTVCLDGKSNASAAKKILSDAGFKGTTIISGTGDYTTMVKKIEYTPTKIILDSSGRYLGEIVVQDYKKSNEAYKDCINKALKKAGKAEI